jgi:hypothetical protein
MLRFLAYGRKRKHSKKCCQCSKSLKCLKGRSLRYEPLEERQLLSIDPVIVDNQSSQNYHESGTNWESWNDCSPFRKSSL